MRAFNECEIEFVSHHSPLHYLPFIGRSRSLKSKPALRDEGFSLTHFRSLSSRSDVKRGFEKYAFLTLAINPRIVQAKLKGGFPHITLLVPIRAFERVSFDFCRYNVAMTRKLRRGEKEGHRESPTNGKYYDGMEVPIAREEADKVRLLKHHYPKGTMIEVLVDWALPLPDDTSVVCYHGSDLELVEEIKNQVGFPWNTTLQEPNGEYNRKQKYVGKVESFVNSALADSAWRGNGLEFDNV